MSEVSIIVAATPGGAIGRGGDLMCHIGPDLRRFKALTLGKPVVMGRLTFESLPGGALPGRRNIVITRRADYAPVGAERAASLDEALAMTAGAPEVMIIGGGQIYAQARDAATCVYLTEVDLPDDGADTFITPFAGDPAWAETDRTPTATDPRTGIAYRFITYRRRP